MGVRKPLLALCATTVLAGCGSHNGASYTSAKAVADAAGCAQPKAAPAAETTLYATDEVSCHHAGHYVLVDWFKDGASLTSFKQASTGSGYAILYGNDWAVSCVDNKADCATFQKTLGGTLE